MSASSPVSAPIRGSEGDLISIRISVEPKQLEDMLDVLSGLHFPVNPQLYHHPASVIVEFPAYESRVAEVREALDRRGFARTELRASGILDAIGMR